MIPDGVARRAELRAGERLCDLQCGGYWLIQKENAFRFSMDAVILSHFAAPKKRDRAIDLGGGEGIVGILMAAHAPWLSVDIVEQQRDMADMAARSVQMNELADRIRVYAMDMREAPRRLGYGCYSLCTCNPPYGGIGTTVVNADPAQRMARHETEITIAEICQTAAALLKNGGRFVAIFPATRAFELMKAMDSARLSPKRAQLIYGSVEKPPKRLLLEGVKQGGAQMHWLPPLIQFEADGTLTQGWLQAYSDGL